MRLTAILLILGACASPPSEPDEAVVRVEAGRADTLALADLPALDASARFGASSEARVEVISGDRIVVETPAGFSGLAQVPYRAGGEEGVLVVHSVVLGGPEGSLRLALVGTEADSPDILAFAVVRRDAAGEAVPPHLDDEESVVALVDDAPFHDNAIDAFDDYVRLDLDAVEPGPHRLRVAVQIEGLVSNWIALDLDDRRPVGK